MSGPREGVGSTNSFEESISELLKPINSWADEDDFSQRVVKELKACLTSESFRASHVLAFQLLMYSIYVKIDEFGLSTFIRMAQKKNVVAEGKIRTLWDLNKIEDSQIIVLAHELGMYDQNIRTLLETALKTRNGCAHVSQLKPSRSATLTFVENVATYCETIRQSDVKGGTPGTIDEIKKASETRVNVLAAEMETQTIISVLEEFFQEAELFTDSSEIASLKKVFVFIKEALTSRRNIDEMKGVYAVLHKEYFSGRLHNRVRRMLQPILASAIGKAEIKKFALESRFVEDYIEEFTQSASFDDAGMNAALVAEFKGKLTKSNLGRICDAICKNQQISSSYKARSTLLDILKSRRTDMESELLKKAMEALGEE